MAKRSMKHRSTRNTRVDSSSDEDKAIRDFAAINYARRYGGGYLTPTIAKVEGTTLNSVRRRFPRALYPSQSSVRLRVRPTDPYSHLVEILGESGEPRVVTAYGSVERTLAGQHRAAYLEVLADRKRGSILKKYRNKTVGGMKLLWDAEKLFASARDGALDDLGALYVSPEASR